MMQICWLINSGLHSLIIIIFIVDSITAERQG